MKMIESGLRDFIAAHLEMVEPGLTLVKVEFKLKNSAGAGGFVDILARDSDGMLVVIELKRLEATARQAIHELSKYTELILNNFGLGATGVRCILLSTVWNELLLPFSQFARVASYDCSARLLELGDNGVPVSSSLVSLAPESSELLVCPHSFYFLYTTGSERNMDVDSLKKALADVGVVDYFAFSIDHAGQGINFFPFAIHLFLAKLDISQKTNVLQLAPFMVDEEYPEWGHELAVFGLAAETTNHSSVEDGRPDQAQSEASNWVYLDLVRSGRFSDSQIWTEEQLRALAHGQDFPETRMFDGSCRPSRRARWRQFRNECDYVVRHVPSWRADLEALDQMVERFPDALVERHIYNPLDLVFTIRRLALGQQDGCPMYRHTIFQAGGRFDAFGVLMWNGVEPVLEFESLIATAYGGAEGYMTAKTMNETARPDLELTQRLGMSYRTVTKDQDGAWLVLNSEYRQTQAWEEIPRPLTVTDFSERNREYVARAANYLSLFS